MGKVIKSIESVAKKIVKNLAVISYLLDIILLPLTILSLAWFRLVKFHGPKKYPLTKKLFYVIGTLPIVKHYYEPLYDPNQLSKPLNSKRTLPSLDLKIDSQINFIKQFQFQDELKNFPLEKKSAKENRITFYYNNGSFPNGDAELYYSIIRQFKPNNIIEIGSGFSTLIALEAIKRNEFSCKLTCVEPYEMRWLEDLELNVLREKVELLSTDFFDQLRENDILFIDSSHIIRPQGDVLFEIMEILPRLNKGVLIHFHDIFTPNDYPLDWLTKEFRLWNEQYLLEAFLIKNSSFEIICSLNYLSSHYRGILNNAFPIFAKDIERKPGSFWIKKIE